MAFKKKTGPIPQMEPKAPPMKRAMGKMMGIKGVPLQNFAPTPKKRGKKK